MNPIGYLIARRRGRIVYARRGGWIGWKLDLLRLRVIERLEQDADRAARLELLEHRRFLHGLYRTAEGRALIDNHEARWSDAFPWGDR